jgi:hypothetical protein
MTYTEQGYFFNTYFPVFFMGFVFGVIALILLYRIFTNKKVVRLLCKSLLAIPALIVILILQVTGYYK